MTSDKKSLIAFCVTDRMARLREARLMILPARRAAFTAVFSIGCIKTGFGSRLRLSELRAPRSKGRIVVNNIDPLKNIRVVLTRPSHPGNIGAAARALKTMGLNALCLVNPRTFPHADADARASGALDVLRHARVHDSLADALGGCVLAVSASSPHSGFPDRKMTAPA